MKSINEKNEIQFIPTELDWSGSTEDQLESILLFLQTKYVMFGEKRDPYNGKQSEFFNPVLSTYLEGWMKEIYEEIQYKRLLRRKTNDE